MTGLRFLKSEIGKINKYILGNINKLLKLKAVVSQWKNTSDTITILSRT